MTTKTPDREKNRLIILDFDGTIYHNPTNNFSVDIPLDDILDVHSFFAEFIYQTGRIVLKETEFILITGRHETQKSLLMPYLKKLKGYKIDLVYFNQMEHSTMIDESSFLIMYWTAKVEIINQLRLSGEYKSIVVIDDDIICSMLQKLNFEVYF